MKVFQCLRAIPNSKCAAAKGCCLAESPTDKLWMLWFTACRSLKTHLIPNLHALMSGHSHFNSGTERTSASLGAGVGGVYPEQRLNSRRLRHAPQAYSLSAISNPSPNIVSLSVSVDFGHLHINHNIALAVQTPFLPKRRRKGSIN